MAKKLSVQDATEPSMAPIAIPVPALTLTNQSILDRAVRALREELLVLQQKRADGRLTIDLHLAGGVLNGIWHVKTDWTGRV